MNPVWTKRCGLPPTVTMTRGHPAPGPPGVLSINQIEKLMYYIRTIYL